MIAAELILRERKRQREKGYKNQHDDRHTDGSLVTAVLGILQEIEHSRNNWTREFIEHAHRKYKDRPDRLLVIAAAMLQAEIDRRIRANQAPAANKEGLRSLIEETAIKRGEITLASGKKSNYYIDCRPTFLTPNGQLTVGRVLMEVIRPFFGGRVGSIAGMELAAVPLITGVLAAVAECPGCGDDLNGIIVRKASKDHGDRSRLVGEVSPYRYTVVLDDVMTTGASAIEAAQVLKAEGANVMAIVGLVDRLQGAGAAVNAAGFNYHAVFTVRDFGIEPDPTE